LTSLIANEIYFYVVVYRATGGITGRKTGFAEIPGYCYNDAGNIKIFFPLFSRISEKERG
jgi:hypothetical protein